MKLIIEREATFENNSDMEVKVTQKKYHEHSQWCILHVVPLLLAASLSFLVSAHPDDYNLTLRKLG